MQQPASTDRLIGKQVETRRTQLGLTLEELAAQMRLSEPEVLAYERGQRRFSAAALLQFAKGLDCSAITLLKAPDEGASRPANQP